MASDGGGQGAGENPAVPDLARLELYHLAACSSSLLLNLLLDTALAPEEREQVGIDLILMRRRDAVRRARIVDFPYVLDELGRFLCRVLNGNDLVVFTVND